MFVLKQLYNNFKNFLFLAFNETGPSRIDEKNNLKEWEEKSDLQKELEKKLSTIEASIKYLSSYGRSLNNGLNRLENNIEDNEDKQELNNLKNKLNNLKEQYNQFLQDWKIVKEELAKLKEWVEDLQKSVDNIEFKKWIEIWENWKIEKNDLTLKDLENISNKEFLKLSPEQRLQYITVNHIDSSSISSWEVKNLEFTFTFDWKFNKNLYLKTTAWQVLPEEVREVVSEWLTYKRDWLKWEFFADWGKRLIIREGTKIEDIKLWDKNEILQMKKEVIEKSSKFLKENPGTKQFEDIVTWAIERNIDPKFAILAFWEQLKDLPIISEERKVLLEDMFTEYDRIKGQIPSIVKNSDDWVKVLLLRKFWWENWENKVKKLWISQDTLKQFEKYNNLSNIDLNNLPNWVKWLLELIGHFESWWNYNAIYWNPRQNRIDFTNMTLKDVINFQIDHGRKTWSSAIWKYQFLSKTLKWLIQENNISLNEKFSPELQDKLAIKLLERRGLNEFLNWKISKEKFIENLSKEWASLPKDSSWLSFYHWDNIGNKAWKNSYAYLDKVLSKIA